MAANGFATTARNMIRLRGAYTALAVSNVAAGSPAYGARPCAAVVRL
jgi:hypothetical protein